MDYYIISFSITSLISFIIALFVLSRNIGSKINITFSLFALSVSIWSFFYILFCLSASDSQALLWDRLLMAGAIFIPVTFTHFVLIHLELDGKYKPFIYANYLFSLFFLLTLPTSLFIKRIITLYNFAYWPDPGIIFHPYFFWFSLNVIIAHLLMLNGLFRFKGLKRTQILYVFSGTLIGFLGGSTNFFMWYKIPIPPVGSPLVAMYVVTVAYAITKHHLMDIEVIIKRTATYSILTALITGIFLSIIAISDYLARSLTGQSSIWVGIIAAFIVALAFQPLRELIQNAVDRLFFRTRYEYQAILGRYSYALARPMADLDRLAKLAPYLLWKSMKLTGASFMVLDRLTKEYIIRASDGSPRDILGQTVPENSPLIQEILAQRREIDREDIEFSLKSDPNLPAGRKEYLQKILAEMDRLGADLFIPSISESEYFNKTTLLAVINLGKKMSDEPFSKEDVGFLETLANQATISIEYAFILEELKKNQERVVASEKLAALGTTTAGIAHELKNPLTYLLTVAQAMGSSWDNQTFKESVIRMFPSEVERMKLIIDGLSDYSKQHELQIEPVEMTGVVEKVIAILTYEIKKNNVFVKKNYPAETEEKAIALADKYRIVQVFMNIIANAVQAMGPCLPAGTAQKGGDLSVTVRNEEKEVRISIMDTGPGIPHEQLQKIFDPFFTTKESGTGLGLSITKKIIDEHKGSIYVDSHVGEGTTFTVCLPKA